MTTPQTSRPGPAGTTRKPQDDRQLYQAAEEHARRATADLARQLAGPAQADGTGMDPLDSLRAAFELERAASLVSPDHCRAAREAGYTWHQIGAALTGLAPSTNPRVNHQIAETAYSYANPRGTRFARAEEAPFTWTCRTCNEAIADYGLTGHPAFDEQGHAPGCSRLLRTIQARQPELEADQ
jgi:hypothetical protein